MAVPMWPQALPRGFVREGIEDSIPNETLRNKMDKGYKTRRKSTIEPYEISVDFELRGEEQWNILKNFVEDTLAGGVIAFNWVHILTGETVLAQLQPDSDEAFLKRSLVGTSMDKWLISLKFKVFKHANII